MVLLLVELGLQVSGELFVVIVVVWRDQGATVASTGVYSECIAFLLFCLFPSLPNLINNIRSRPVRVT